MGVQKTSSSKQVRKSLSSKSPPKSSAQPEKGAKAVRGLKPLSSPSQKKSAGTAKISPKITPAVQSTSKSSLNKAPSSKTPNKVLAQSSKVPLASQKSKAAEPASSQAKLEQQEQKKATPKSRGKAGQKTASSGKSKLSLEGMGETVCREVACEGLSTSAGYCRLHYIKNWKKIKRKELILREKKLNQYIEELVAKYPDKYIEAIRQDLASDKDFAKVIYDLDLDEGADDFDMDGDNVDAFIDTIKRDFDDDSDVY